jgi:hypothetical protein
MKRKVEVDPPPNHHQNAHVARHSKARASGPPAGPRRDGDEIHPMNPHDLLSRRRAALALLAAACLVPVAGCQRDETVRGAGSIDIPAEDLKLKVTPKGKRAKPKG